jgi:hypothetical protein
MPGQPGGTESGVQVCAAGHWPPQVLYVPPQKTGPEQAQFPSPGSTQACPDRHGNPHAPGPAPQFGIPRVVVVGHIEVLVVVVVVVAPQQNPTASGVSTISDGLHTSRTLTLLAKVPSRRRLAQRTAASAIAVAKTIPMRPATKRDALGIVSLP